MSVKSKKDGGSAFPRSIGSGRNESGFSIYNKSQEGMTLRDYFAAKAAPIFMKMRLDSAKEFMDQVQKGGCGQREIEETLKEIEDINPGRLAYDLADNMLEEREK